MVGIERQGGIVKSGKGFESVDIAGGLNGWVLIRTSSETKKSCRWSKGMIGMLKWIRSRLDMTRHPL